VYNNSILSQPLDIYFAGFKSNTINMQQAGWDISAHEDKREMTMQLAFRHRQLQMYGLSNKMAFNYYENRANHEYYRTVSLNIHQVAHNIIISYVNTLRGYNGFQEINATPECIDRKERSIEDLNFFSKAPREVIVKPEKEIIIPEQDLDGLLDQILGKYENTNREYHTKVTQAQQTTRVAAQIITLAR